MRITLDLRWSYFQVSLVKINQAKSKTYLNLDKLKGTRHMAQKSRSKTATLEMVFLNNQFKSTTFFLNDVLVQKNRINIKMLINHQTFRSVISPCIIRSLKDSIYMTFETERHAVNKICGKKVVQA